MSGGLAPLIFRRVRKIAGSDSFVMFAVQPVRPSAWNISAPTGRIFVKFDLSIFRKSVEIVQLSVMSDKNNRYFYEDQCTFLIISCSILLRMRNVAHTSCRENQSTHFKYNNFFPKIVSCKIMWKDMV